MKKIEVRKSLYPLMTVLIFYIFSSNVLSQVRVLPPAKKADTAVGIFVDAETYRRIGEAVQDYRDAVEADGLSAYIVISEWPDPMVIRDQIRNLMRKEIPLEGIVLVGDIPIPMILDAQHLTSAFKMDQERFARIRTGVPSDRFYDDLDLKFDYIDQDEVNPLLFYYSLSPESPQKLESDIYSGRIKPPVQDESRYEMLEKYLRRVARQKKMDNRLDRGIVISGHGYHSESLTAWTGEHLELREHFPRLFQSGGQMHHLYHQMDIDLKREALLQLQQPELDMAIFHAHGDDDLQYLSGLPEGRNVQENIEAVKYYLRSKIRQAERRRQSVEATISDFREKLDVPESWFAGTFEDSVILADSLLNYGLDIHVADIRNISPQAEFMIHDQCFNGAFIHAPYIAGEYVFGNGTVVAAAANSVNIIQDLWANENLGILALGARVGFWNKSRNYLETHIIGDPTFRFAGAAGRTEKEFWKPGVVSGRDWRKYITHSSPVVRAWAVHELYALEGQKYEPDLIRIYREETAFIVRLQALKCLARSRSAAFQDILKLSVTDPSELIRRISVKWMGDIGREEYLPFLVDNLFLDPAKRVNTNAWEAISRINASAALTVARDRAANLPVQYIDGDILDRLITRSRSDSTWIYEQLLPAIASDSLELKKRISTVRTFRYYRFQSTLPFLQKMLQDQNQPEMLRRTVAEALGWYTFSYQRESILQTCRTLLMEVPDGSPVTAEIRKTIRRLETGANNPVTP